MRLDLSKVETFEPLPTGVYLLEVIEQEEKEGNESGNPYINWTLEVVEPAAYAGRKLWIITSLIDKALWKLKETLIAFGADEAVISAEGGFDFEADAWIGSRCIGNVIQENYKGKIQNRVDTVVRVQADSAPWESTTAESAGKKTIPKSTGTSATPQATKVVGGRTIPARTLK